MTAPRLEVRLEDLRSNAQVLVSRLAPRGIRVTGVTKAALGHPAVAAAFLDAGVAGLGDSRVDNLARIRAAHPNAPLTLIRAPMPSQVGAVVALAERSLGSETTTFDALSAACLRKDVRHEVVLMVELGDLREGVPATDLVDLARHVATLPGLVLLGVGTNLACQSGVVPDDANMGELSRLADAVEAAIGYELAVVSGGNSANLAWALTTKDVGRVDDLRLGEALFLGTEPLHRQPIEGLRTRACTLFAEVIELQLKPSLPWGDTAQAAFTDGAPRSPRRGTVRQALLAVGRQDVDPDSVVPPEGASVLGASSDHLVLDVGDLDVSVGDEVAFGLGYSGLVRAMTSPFVTTVPLR